MECRCTTCTNANHPLNSGIETVFMYVDCLIDSLVVVLNNFTWQEILPRQLRCVTEDEVEALCIHFTCTGASKARAVYGSCRSDDSGHQLHCQEWVTHIHSIFMPLFGVLTLLVGHCEVNTVYLKWLTITKVYVDVFGRHRISDGKHGRACMLWQVERM